MQQALLGQGPLAPEAGDLDSIWFAEEGPFHWYSAPWVRNGTHVPRMGRRVTGHWRRRTALAMLQPLQCRMERVAFAPWGGGRDAVAVDG